MKKNWVIAKSAASSLAARCRRSLVAVGRARVDLGVGGHTDREPGRVLAHLRDELGGVLEVAAGLGAVGGRVAAEGEDVLHAVGGVVVEQLRDVGAWCGRRR